MAVDHGSTCHGSLVQPSRRTPVRQNAFAASRPASSSCDQFFYESP
jgi:hypothetical protein